MLKQINVLPIRERVASEIRNAIFSGSLAPGEELGQDSLAAKLGISRMPVREALQILAGEGLVELRMNRGAIVKDVSAESVREHFEVRLTLECEAVARACSRITDFSELEYIHEEQRKAIENLDVAKANMCNQALHMYIWEHAGNKKLKNILVQLWNGLSIGTVVRPIDHMRLSFEEHARILEALKRRDEGTARSVMADHLKRSMENMMRRPSGKKEHEPST